MPGNRPPLTIAEIFAWADAHHARTGNLPTRRSGPVTQAPGETRANVNQALEKGLARAAPALLHRALAEHRGAPYRWKGSRLTVRQVLAWARAYRRRTGKWPAQRSGPIAEAPDETWQGIDAALRYGRRGL